MATPAQAGYGGEEDSIGFDRGSVEVRATAVPAIRRVVEMLRRHTALTLAIEAHCGLDAHAEFARRRRPRGAAEGNAID